MRLTDDVFSRRERRFFDDDLNVSDWGEIQPLFDRLLEMPVDTTGDLILLMERCSELFSILWDELMRRKIEMRRHADEEKSIHAFEEYNANVWSKAEAYDPLIYEKFHSNPLRDRLPLERYGMLVKKVANDISLLREENVPLLVTESKLCNRYNAVTSKQTVVFRGEEIRLIGLTPHLKDPDRAVREKAWRLALHRLGEDGEILNRLLDDMIEIRTRIAKNAGIGDYRDFMHGKKYRFSYTPDDLYRFHASVEKVVLPFVRELNRERRKKLNLARLRPWDTSVDGDRRVLKPFETTEELVDKSIAVLYRIRNDFGVHLNKLRNSGLLDLDSRKGKAPGGYCTPRERLGAAFIHLNLVGSHQDIVDFMHECGHAIHFFHVMDEPLIIYRNLPGEVQELAAKAMELLSSECYGEYYPDGDDVRGARRELLEKTVRSLPDIVMIDAFQHWMYTNPLHGQREREECFARLLGRFDTGVDWGGLEEEKRIVWMQRHHIFNMPFYFVEYAISQLGALAVYRNYKREGGRVIDDYVAFMKLGHSREVDEIYRAAGIEFDFSEGYVEEMVEFVRQELRKLSPSV